jgi:hypothetical protein
MGDMEEIQFGVGQFRRASDRRINAHMVVHRL